MIDIIALKGKDNHPAKRSQEELSSNKREELQELRDEYDELRQSIDSAYHNDETNKQLQQVLDGLDKQLTTLKDSEMGTIPLKEWDEEVREIADRIARLKEYGQTMMNEAEYAPLMKEVKKLFNGEYIVTARKKSVLTVQDRLQQITDTLLERGFPNKTFSAEEKKDAAIDLFVTIFEGIVVPKKDSDDYTVNYTKLSEIKDSLDDFLKERIEALSNSDAAYDKDMAAVLEELQDDEELVRAVQSAMQDFESLLSTGAAEQTTLPHFSKDELIRLIKDLRKKKLRVETIDSLKVNDSDIAAIARLKKIVSALYVPLPSQNRYEAVSNWEEKIYEMTPQKISEEEANTIRRWFASHR